MLICTNCGVSLTSKDKFCPTCGYGKENKMKEYKCLHEYVAVYTLEEISQSYNLKEDEWDGDTDFGRIHKVISATCNDCDMDLTDEVAKRLKLDK